jgi:hypothetical protein
MDFLIGKCRIIGALINIPKLIHSGIAVSFEIGLSQTLSNACGIKME